ncbi:hypothetical protein GJAV_G00151240 [Gymnothorax javanicus]|nr:hypothetical protein GJAV_G00151240 [Gymnothorax javanicus]
MITEPFCFHCLHRVIGQTGLLFCLKLKRFPQRKEQKYLSIFMVYPVVRNCCEIASSVYNFPPFFTLQPNVDTRQKQLAAWCSLTLSYCRHRKLYTLDVMEAQESPVFNNKKIERKLSMEAIQVVFEELRKKGNLEWIDKNKTRCLIMWRRPEEWGKLIYQWVSGNGMVNSVFTLYELSNGDDTESEEFHGLEEWLLVRSLQTLQSDGKAELINMDDGKGVKFF